MADSIIAPAQTPSATQTKMQPLSRWQAAGIHLLISAGIAAITLFVMLRVWYPPPLFLTEGGNDLLFTLVAVDVVLGPLITLIIFKSGKPNLRFDLAVIAALQACALIYGCYVMFAARPIFVTYIIDRFEVVRANDIDPADLAQAPDPAFRSAPITGPQRIAVNMPKNMAELKTLMTEAQKGGKVAQHLPKYYVPYATLQKQALEQSQPLDNILKRDASFAAWLEKQIADSGYKVSDVRFIMLQTRRGAGAVLLDAKTGDIVKLLPPPDL